MVKKSKLMVFCAIMLCFVMLFAFGCTKEEEPAGRTETLRLAIGGSQQGGTSYIQAGGLGKVLEENMENTTASVEATTGSVENAKLVNANTCQMSFVLADIAKYAYHGEEQFKEAGAQTNLRILMVGSYSYLHWVTRADSGIDSIEQVKGKRLGAGSPGSSISTLAVPGVLAAYGIDVADVDMYYLSMAETTTALLDGTIDVGVYFAAFPASGVSEVALSQNIKLLNVTDEAVAKVIETMPFFVTSTIPAGTYNKVDTDTTVLGVATTIVSNTSVSEADAYEILDVMYSHIEDWKAVHAGTAAFTPEALAAWDQTSMPLHDGAIKYLKEKGLLK